MQVIATVYLLPHLEKFQSFKIHILKTLQGECSTKYGEQYIQILKYNSENRQTCNKQLPIVEKRQVKKTLSEVYCCLLFYIEVEEPKYVLVESKEVRIH